MASLPPKFPNLQSEQQPRVTSLGDVLSAAGAVTRPLAVLMSRNMGNTTFTMSLPIQTFMERSEVANERGLENSPDYEGQGPAQRPLDVRHATKFAVYVLKALAHSVVEKHHQNRRSVPAELLEIQNNLGRQTYHVIQPLVCNIRDCELGGTDLQVSPMGGNSPFFLAYLAERLMFWIVDGQHRRAALQMVVEFLRAVRTNHKYPSRPKLYHAATKEALGRGELNAWNEMYDILRADWTVTMEVHLGLTADHERQMFHDLNNLGKRVEESLAYRFDEANPVNYFIKHELVKTEDDGGFWKPALVERDVVDWRSDEGAISRKDVIAVNAILFLNKTNVAGAQPSMVSERKDVALRFWEAVNQINGFGEPGAKEKTIAAQPVALKALAKLTYDFAFGKNPDADSLETLLDGIANGGIDFSHSNPLWRYYELKPDEVKKHGLRGLSDYLPSDDTGANRDLGNFDPGTGVFRFGAKHNDIYPILGDMIRWQLKLVSRHAETVVA
jgi:hypothetical protein